MPSDHYQGEHIRSRRSGFTLLEVLLTLSLSVILMALVGSVFEFYTQEMDSSDLDIRQTMLASAILQMIEDDLRATIHGEPADMEALEAILAANGGALASAAGGGGGGGGDGDGGGGAGDLPDEDLGEAEDEEEIEAPELDSGIATLSEPGLIGNQYQIQVDVSRLPRLEEHFVLINEDTNTTIQDFPSDIKTVSYYVQQVGGGVEDELANDTNSLSDTGGLVRRSLDRAATTFALENGNFNLLNQTGDVVAPEVVALEFSYWDGVTWLLEWNSDEIGELPFAIKVQLTMADIKADQSSASTEQPNLRVFTHIIRIPLARVIEEEEEEEDLSAAGI